MRRLLLTFAAALLGSGCAHTYERDWVAPSYDAGKAGRVAVLPLENHTSYPNAGETVSELLATELRVRGFDVLDGHEVRRKLELQADDEGRKLARADLAALARQLQVDSLVSGSVGEFRYKRDLGEDPVVGFSVRMLDRAKGEVVWSSSRSRSEFGLLYHRDYLHENAQRIVEGMVDFLMEQAATQDPLPPRARPSEPAQKEEDQLPPDPKSDAQKSDAQKSDAQKSDAQQGQAAPPKEGAPQEGQAPQGDSQTPR
ncbi:MAG: hypothetical protein AB7N76_35100 [Planctomycetota bacterium]